MNKMFPPQNDYGRTRKEDKTDTEQQQLQPDGRVSLNCWESSICAPFARHAARTCTVDCFGWILMPIEEGTVCVTTGALNPSNKTERTDPGRWQKLVEGQLWDNIVFAVGLFPKKQQLVSTPTTSNCCLLTAFAHLTEEWRHFGRWTWQGGY